MPTVNGVYTPISANLAGRMYVQAMAIIRSQLGKEAQGVGTRDDQYIMQRLTTRFLGGQTVQPADRGRMLQIIRGAESAHNQGIGMNADPDRAVPLAGLNIDPTLSPNDARVRYRVIVIAEDVDGNRSEGLQVIDSDRILSSTEAISRAIDQARRDQGTLSRNEQSPDYNAPQLVLRGVVVSAGKRR